MDIRTLEYFLAVARAESITRAAEALHMTQPPLSRQLKDLENELGTKLLIRGSRKVTLTEDGLLLRRRAEQIMELMGKTKAELTGAGGQIEGDVHIGGGETAAAAVLAEAAARLRQEFPNIRFHLYSGDADRVTEKLDKGLIDFGLLVGPVDVQKYEYIRLPVRDRWGVLLRRDSPLADRPAVGADDLRDMPLILSRQISKSSELSLWLQAHSGRLDMTATYDLIYNATHFVRSGLGCAVALDGLVNTAGDSDLCFRLLHPLLQADLYLAWTKEQIFSRAARQFLGCLRDSLDSAPAT